MDLGFGGLVYQTGGTNWIIYQTPSAGTGKHTLGGWTVPNIMDAMRELRREGCHVRGLRPRRPGANHRERRLARDPSGGAAAWFKDSEDNVVSINELPPGMAVPGTTS